MKAQKNKIVFVLVMVCVVLFITVYALVTFGKDKKTELNPDRIPMPDLDGNTLEYESKMEALDAIKEERETTAPQLYPDHMVDDKGYFNPDYMEYEKHRIIDSIYQSKSFVDDEPPLRVEETLVSKDIEPEGEKERVAGLKKSISPQEMVLNHQVFFASKPVLSKDVGDTKLLAYVDGEQTLREGHRLAMRLEEDVEIKGVTLARGTQVYGFVKLRPNRVMVKIDQVGDYQMKLQVYDLQDKKAGIYVENHLKGEIVQTSMDETLGGVNLPGLPQVGGIKRIFQRDRRAIKVEVSDKYQIILKQQL
ncbi:conjugative transposon protein TraM [Muricauda sp. CAU 1633]|uniref:conjugative transposon protein TraM n=1 Tax=Allomuricauda sp. CAU 1633 TaxID=2816036 RepID=UPI001A8F3E94|nr:conjugative transposon protein TraM [Muricauda sp. CAU 1633]MBO0322185.1 conjugative transposon protein TraM [Muricauda sp. CAU 1633]